MDDFSVHLLILVAFLAVFVFFMRLSAQRAKQMLSQFEQQARRTDEAARRAEEQNRLLERIAAALETRQK